MNLLEENNILEIKNLSKSFNGKKILDNISLKVAKGSIFGFLGKNGAGKTTTMKMILGLLKIDSGSIMVCNEKVTFGKTKSNQFVGYLPDVPEFYGYMKPYQYLKLSGEIAGMKSSDIKKQSEELLYLVGLDKANKRIYSFSRGMKQRLGIAQAMIHSPKLLICDEPTSALDPLGRKELLEILLKIRNKTTVIFSTHILSDVERICDKIAVLNNGKIVLQGDLTEIKQKHKTDNTLISFKSKDDLNKFIKHPAFINLSLPLKTEENSLTINSNNSYLTMSNIIKILSDSNITPNKLEIIEPSLENLFVEAIK